MKKRNFLTGLILTTVVGGVTYFFLQDKETESYVKVSAEKIVSKQKVVRLNATQPKVIKAKKTNVVKNVPIKRSVASSGKKPARSLSSTFKSIKNKARKEISELRKLSQSQFKTDDGVEFLNGLFAERVKRKEEPIKTYGGFYIYDTHSKENNIGIAIKDGRLGVVTGEIAFQTKDIESLKNKIQKHNAQEIMSDKNIGVYIVQAAEHTSYESILNDSDLSSFNPKPDIVFDYKLPR
ncbi:MAG: hypothetical protein CME62_00875 [Halobacteriovoraceae bacterium]|nr:hypothetical protein [Halobacteriovoraceae bacterium]|tara:strand:+ start:13323 stop:14033 length:711 start_codon:yes stop_codon:yes gene_type:complete